MIIKLVGSIHQDGKRCYSLERKISLKDKFFLIVDLWFCELTVLQSKFLGKQKKSKRLESKKIVYLNYT